MLIWWFWMSQRCPWQNIWKIQNETQTLKRWNKRIKRTVKPRQGIKYIYGGYVYISYFQMISLVVFQQMLSNHNRMCMPVQQYWTNGLVIPSGLTNIKLRPLGSNNFKPYQFYCNWFVFQQAVMMMFNIL